jgi:toxin CptA
MDLMLASLAFAIAAACAGVMGFAIQRGGTCTVAAVDELVSQGRATRLLAMGEAALWVAVGLLAGQSLGLLPALPVGHPVNGFTVFGGVLLGLGAWLNGACVFGAVARLGSGEWAYAATPLGFYLGCLSLPRLFDLPTPAATSAATALPVFSAGLALAVALAALASWRAGKLLRALWQPHAATVMIGITFVVLLAVGGAWTYTDVLAELAQGMAGALAVRIGLVVALFAGALLGGYTAGRLRSARPPAAALARCLAGGMLMAWGTLLIPGANDGLILIGMPLLRPYAWLAFAAMALSIAAALLIVRLLRGVRARSGATP